MRKWEKGKAHRAWRRALEWETDDGILKWAIGKLRRGKVGRRQSAWSMVLAQKIDDGFLKLEVRFAVVR